MALITQAFDSLDSYTAFFSQEPLPVLKHTVKELQAMREHEDSINGRTVAALVLSDPMMTLKVLIYMEEHRRAGKTMTHHHHRTGDHDDGHLALPARVCRPANDRGAACKPPPKPWSASSR